MTRIGRIVLCLVFLAGLARSAPQQSGYEGFTFSPDGTYLMAVYLHDGSALIYKIPIDTGKATRFTSATEGFEGVPSFSPDGKKIAYSFSPGHGAPSRIVIANVDGSDAHPLGNPAVNGGRPLFSPDNKTIIFARSGYYGSYSPIAQPAHHEWNFYEADLDGNNVRQLTNESLYLVSRASLSPDGKKLLFVDSFDGIAVHSTEEPPKPKVMLKPRLNGKKAEVYSEAVFSADGKSIFFTAASDGWERFNYNIYRLDLETQSVEPLTADKGHTGQLQVSRDGQRAVFVHDEYRHNTSTVFLLDLRTRQSTPLTITGIP